MAGIESLINVSEFSKENIKSFLSISEQSELNKLFELAYKIKKKYVGTKVYLRGLIEFSNVCQKNCFYCGIRKDNKEIKRYTLPKDEIIKLGLWCYEQGYGSVILQSGERTSKDFVLFVEDIIKTLKRKTNDKLGITLCLGEQSFDTYKRWFEAGAHRYLLRIETSSPSLYKKLHPYNHSFENRIKCLEMIKKVGYQVGTGVLIGVPYQTIEDLVNDVLFFKKMDVDMIGMGPYIKHENTPLGKKFQETPELRKKRFLLGLKMIAVVRIFLKDVNIAATTALQTLDPTGREKGLLAGANVIMPIVTPQEYRENYFLYNGKPCINDATTKSLVSRIESIGETIGFYEWGDAPHFFKRKNKKG